MDLVKDETLTRFVYVSMSNSCTLYLFLENFHKKVAMINDVQLFLRYFYFYLKEKFKIYWKTTRPVQPKIWADIDTCADWGTENGPGPLMNPALKAQSKV